MLWQILIVSGGKTSNSPTDSTEIFDPNEGKWVTGAALPSPRYGLSAVNIDDRVLIFGRYAFLIYWCVHTNAY